VAVVAVGQPLVIGKVGERKRPGLFAGELVELGVAMAIGGEDVFGVEALAVGVALACCMPFSGSSSSFFASRIATGRGMGRWDFDAQR